MLFLSFSLACSTHLLSYTVNHLLNATSVRIVQRRIVSKLILYKMKRNRWRIQEQVYLSSKKMLNFNHTIVSMWMYKRTHGRAYPCTFTMQQPMVAYSMNTLKYYKHRIANSSSNNSGKQILCECVRACMWKWMYFLLRLHFHHHIALFFYLSGFFPMLPKKRAP